MKNGNSKPCGCQFEVHRSDGGGRYFVSVACSTAMLMGSIYFHEVTPANRKADAFQFSYDLDQAEGMESRLLIRIAIAQAIKDNLFAYLSRPIVADYDLDLTTAPYAGALTFID